jgi:nucleoside 2-deoxyribosyltransferase
MIISSKPFIIYCAGSMEHVTLAEAKGWREEVKEFFYRRPGLNVKLLDPTRRLHSGKQHEMRRIFDLDMMDLGHCDIVLANLNNPSLAKHGTACEVFHAGYHLRKPVVAFKSSAETYHPFFESCVTEWRSDHIKACETIEEHYL